jgi:hypothetical protein
MTTLCSEHHDSQSRFIDRCDPRAAGIRRMIVLDTKVLAELMKRSPAEAVMVWMSAQRQRACSRPDHSGRGP